MKNRKRDVLIGVLIVVAAVLFKVVLTIANAHLGTATAVDIAHLPVQSGHVTIAITNEEYHPNIVVVTRGTTITWVNRDPMSHTVTEGHNAAPTPGGFNSNQLASGQSWSYVFHNPETYLYTCAYHVNMNARVVVR
jgi:plastocyanin